MPKIIKRALRGIKKAYGRFEIAKHGFWFVDIPRTSSTSIRVELGERFGSVYGKRKVIESEYATKQIFSDHIPAREMQEMLGGALWSRIFTFTMIRNPWDRVYSMYTYRRKRKQIPDQWSFRDYVLALSGADQDAEFFKQRGFRYGLADYVLDNNGELIVDFIARYETREQDLMVIASQLKIENLGRTLHLQSARPDIKHYSCFYDEDTRRIIGDVYRKDIELFGYEFEEHDW